jgi:Ca2+-binding EF-hand superfamily protein
MAQSSHGAAFHAGQLPPAEESVLRRLCRLLEVFDALDRTGRGRVQEFELATCLDTMVGIRCTSPQIKALFAFLHDSSQHAAGPGALGAEEAKAISRVDFVMPFLLHESLASGRGRGQPPPDIFAEVAPKLCNPEVVLERASGPPRGHEVPVGQMRQLLRGALPSWRPGDVDEVLQMIAVEAAGRPSSGGGRGGQPRVDFGRLLPPLSVDGIRGVAQGSVGVDPASGRQFKAGQFQGTATTTAAGRALVQAAQTAWYESRLTLRDVFNRVDQERTGAVRLSALAKFLRSSAAITVGEPQLCEALGVPAGTSVSFALFRAVFGAAVSRPPQADWEESVFKQMRKTVNDEYRKQCRTAFNSFAREGKAALPFMSAAEFKTAVCAMSQLGGRLQAWEHRQLFFLLDKNGDGKLQPEEWALRFDGRVAQAGLQTRALRKLKDVIYHRKLPLQQFLRDCDANGDGAISATELQQAVLRLVDPGTRPGGAALPAGCVLSKGETRELAGQFAAGSRVDLGALGTALSALDVGSDEEMLRRVREALLKSGGGGRGGGAADDAVLRRAFATLDVDGGGTSRGRVCH